MENCGNCKHLNKKAGACKRFPPQVSYIIVPKHTFAGLQPVEESRSAFPSVKEEWVCGEWAPALKVLS